MNGTLSVDFGKGNTLTELWSAAVWAEDAAPALERIKRISRFALRHRLARVDRSGRPELAIYKVNVKLTGAPLTSEDIQRIAACK